MGIQLEPVQKLGALGPDILEALVEHWVRKKTDVAYARVARFAGPNDKGRDVVGFRRADGQGPWDNYQCKRYQAKLAPAAIWPELGKLVYWSDAGAFTVPETYTFVAPLGCSAKTHDLLLNHDALRKALAKNWSRYCADLCPYDGIKDALARFAFPAFDVVQGGDIVSDLEGSAIFAIVFGGGLARPRPPAKMPPEQIAQHEVPYVSALVEAYDDHCATGSVGLRDAVVHDVYGRHLRVSRREFYCAESLREFSKDVLIEPDTFEALQEQISDGVEHTIARAFPTGYDRVLEVCQQATSVQIDDHPLKGDLQPADRAGICHQLANDGRVMWVPSG